MTIRRSGFPDSPGGRYPAVSHRLARARRFRRRRRHRHRRRLEVVVRVPAETGRATQAVPQEARASLAALGDDLAELRLQAEAAGSEQHRQRYQRVHDH